MATRPSEGPRERKRAQPVPDTDSLATDDRGTRPYRDPQPDEHDRFHESLPGDEIEQPPEHPDDGNYIGDPIKPDDTIRASDAPDSDVPDVPADLLDDWTPAPSDAPTIIRDINRRSDH